MSITIEDLVEYGNVGYYKFIKVTMLILLIDEKPINYFTCLEFSQEYEHEEKFKYLSKCPKSIRTGIQLCVGQAIISVDKFKLIWKDCIDKKEFSIEDNLIILDNTFETDARFIPAIDPTVGQLDMHIPVEKYLFGSNFCGNYYLVELFSDNKILNILSNYDLDKIQKEINSIALLYKLNILTDKIGNLICKFPIELVKYEPKVLNRQKGIVIDFEKDTRMSQERKFLLTFSQEFDQCICYNNIDENFDFRQIAIRPNQFCNKIRIVDSEKKLMIFAMDLDFTLFAGYRRIISPPYYAVDVTKFRKLKINGEAIEIQLGFISGAGVIHEYVDAGRIHKRNAREEQRFLHDNYLLRVYQTDEHE